MLPRVLEPLRLASLLQTVLNPRGWPERVWTDRFEMPIALWRLNGCRTVLHWAEQHPQGHGAFFVMGCAMRGYVLALACLAACLAAAHGVHSAEGSETCIVLLLACIEATLWYLPCSGVVICHNLSPLRHEPSSAPLLKCLPSNLQSTYCKLAMAAWHKHMLPCVLRGVSPCLGLSAHSPACALPGGEGERRGAQVRCWSRSWT